LFIIDFFNSIFYLWHLYLKISLVLDRIFSFYLAGSIEVSLYARGGGGQVEDNFTLFYSAKKRLMPLLVLEDVM